MQVPEEANDAAAVLQEEGRTGRHDCSLRHQRHQRRLPGAHPEQQDPCKNLKQGTGKARFKFNKTEIHFPLKKDGEAPWAGERDQITSWNHRKSPRGARKPVFWACACVLYIFNSAFDVALDEPGESCWRPSHFATSWGTPKSKKETVIFSGAEFLALSSVSPIPDLSFVSPIAVVEVHKLFLLEVHP